jgi:hypothetical protein
MATSGTTTFSITRNDLISASLRGLGVLEESAQPTANMIENASLVLNMMLKDWMTDGIKMWTIDEYTLPLVSGQTDYTIGPSISYNLNKDKPLRLIQAFLRNTSVSPYVDQPLIIISQQEYNFLGSKFSTGTSNSVYYWPYVDYGKLKVFLTPDSNTASNYEIYLTVQRPIQDINKANETFDFPSEWYQALRWGLASELILDYGVPDQKSVLITQRAQMYKERLAAWDTENASTMFQPDMRMASSRFR